MEPQAHVLDHSTLDLGSVRLRAKDGLKFNLRRKASEVWYLVEDEVNGRFYRLGITEATLLSLLDGKRTVREALALAAQFSDQAHLDDVSASGICDFLLQSGLVSTAESRTADRLQGQLESQSKAKRIQWLNPISVSIPLFNPDRWLDRLHRVVGFAIGWPLVIVGSLAILFGLLKLWMHWDELTLYRLAAYSPLDWLWMGASWLLIKLVHELGHGLVCKKFGGRVPQAGLVLFLFIPLPFLNTTSAWSFSRRWQRMAVASAGIFFEMLIATLAIVVWSNLAPGPWRFYLEDLILAAMLHTLIFNLNPLMKFDGYYLLADFLELNNLSQQGKRFVSAVLTKWFIDPRTELPQERRLQGFIRCYGVAAAVWSILLTISIWIAACNLIEGIGLMMALMALGAWSISWVGRMKKLVWIEGRWQRARIKRLVASCSAVGAGLLMAGIFLPAPPTIVAPMVIEHQDRETLRALSTGFIKTIHVKPQQRVRAGDLLLEIDNPDLLLRRSTMLTELRQVEIESRVAQEADEIAKVLMLKEKLVALQNQLQELEGLIAGLQVFAPRDGEIITADLPQRLGQYLQVGDEILELGDSQRLAALALVKPSDVKHLRPADRQLNQVLVAGSGQPINAAIQTIAPRASNHLPHPGFAACYGGTLDVVVDSPGNKVAPGAVSESKPSELIDSSKEVAKDLSLTEALVQVRLELAEDDPQVAGHQLRAGQLGYVHISARDESLGRFVFNRISKWLSHQFFRSHGL